MVGLATIEVFDQVTGFGCILNFGIEITIEVVEEVATGHWLAANDFGAGVMDRAHSVDPYRMWKNRRGSRSRTMLRTGALGSKQVRIDLLQTP
ncbi:hypothetical protein D3C78_1650610 [compost metagenome]